MFGRFFAYKGYALVAYDTPLYIEMYKTMRFIR